MTNTITVWEVQEDDPVEGEPPVETRKFKSRSEAEDYADKLRKPHMLKVTKDSDAQHDERTNADDLSTDGSTFTGGEPPVAG